MKRSRYFLAALAALTVSVTASAQSKSFSLGKWVELHNAILKELNRSYVDSLEVGRIEREGVDAMLSALDPYTVYVPEEEQEDFQMMLSNTYGGIGAVTPRPASAAATRSRPSTGKPPTASRASRVPTRCAASPARRSFSA